MLHLHKITCNLSLNRPDVDFDVRLMRAVQVMDIPMLKDFINALVMDSLTYGKKNRFTLCPISAVLGGNTRAGSLGCACDWNDSCTLQSIMPIQLKWLK